MKQVGKQRGRERVERQVSEAVADKPQPLGNTGPISRGDIPDCGQLLHDLSNVLGGMLMNAQVMQWKLPAYSHSKRYVREIERSAQRAGSLVKQLVRRLSALEQGCEPVRVGPLGSGDVVAVTAQEPSDQARVATAMPLSAAMHAAPAFSRTAVRSPHIVL